MQDLGKTDNSVINLVLTTGIRFSPSRPEQLPVLQAGHQLFCGYDQGLGERLFLIEALADAQRLYDAYANGGALTIKWYEAPVLFVEGDPS